MKMLRCRIADSVFPAGAGDVVVNADQIVWFGSYPDQPGKTLVKLTGDANVLLILAPFQDVAEELLS